MRRVVDSPYRWVGESLTPRIVDTEGRRLPVSLSRGVVFRIRISSRIWSQNRNGSKCSVRDLCRTDLYKNLWKSGLFPCPFNISVIYQPKNLKLLPQIAMSMAPQIWFFKSAKVSRRRFHLPPAKMRKNPVFGKQKLISQKPQKPT
jgi:hypothetical protein